MAAPVAVVRLGSRVKKALKYALAALSAVRLIPLIALMLVNPNRNTVYADLDRWGPVYGFEKPRNLMDRILLFIHLMTWLREYRNVFYLRAGTLGKLLSILCRPKSSLYLGSTSVGPGFFIMHGDCTFVSANRIGENCWINQQVVIGYTNDNPADLPRIGNNVTIHAGGKVLGRVNVGDNATIGANSVVIGDVPPNVTVMGVPAKIIWKKGISTGGRFDE
jgi:serine O-acetyltransferase